MPFSTASKFSDYQRYVWETFVLDGRGATQDAAGATIAASGAPAGVPGPGVAATPHVPAYQGTPALAGTEGQTLSVAPNYRAMLVFFKKSSAGGGFMTIDGVRYDVDMGGSRGDPMLAFSIQDENSVWVAEPVIQAFDGAIVEVQVQREVS